MGQHDNHLLAKIGQYGLIKNSEDKVLVLERARSKTWSLPGGRLDNGEEPHEAFTREIKEELNLECSDLKPFDVNIITDQWQTKFCVYYSVDVVDLDSLQISDEHSGHKWISLEEAENLDIEDEKVRDVVVKFLKNE